VSLKLFLILVVAGVLVNVAVFFGMRAAIASSGGREIIDHNVRLYLRSLVDELGPTPDAARLTALAKRTGLAVSVEKADGTTLASEAGLPTSVTASGGRPFRLHHFRKAAPLEAHGQRYVFFAPNGASGFLRAPEVTLTTIAFVTLVFVLSFYAMKRTLAPLKGLMTGVTAVAAGDVDHRVEARGKDELARLGRAFNHMTQRIRDMMKAKEQLLVDVSHELRAPVTRMKLALELLPDAKGKARLSGYLGEIEHMVSEILESARLDATSPALSRMPTDLRALVDGCAASFRDRPPGVTLRAGETVVADVDASRIAIVVRNLLENAVKYSDPRGRAVEVSVEDAADGVAVRVRDHGVGIPASEVAKVFEPFYRVDKSRSKGTGGFGLGLSLCQKIVAAHGGTITLASAPGCGTTAAVSLPKAGGVKPLDTDAAANPPS